MSKQKTVEKLRDELVDLIDNGSDEKFCELLIHWLGSDRLYDDLIESIDSFINQSTKKEARRDLIEAIKIMKTPKKS